MFFLFLLIQCKLGSNERKPDEKAKTTEEVIVPKGFPKFEFSEEIHKFGLISEGEIVVCDFFFKNIGTRELIISNIETSCGCTAVEWDKKPIGVGKESKLTVQFDSKGRYGKQYKVITIFCNTLEGTKELVITAQIN